jgi:hypothetical protein
MIRELNSKDVKLYDEALSLRSSMMPKTSIVTTRTVAISEGSSRLWIEWGLLQPVLADRQG